MSTMLCTLFKGLGLLSHFFKLSNSYNCLSTGKRSSLEPPSLARALQLRSFIARARARALGIGGGARTRFVWGWG